MNKVRARLSFFILFSLCLACLIQGCATSAATREKGDGIVLYQTDFSVKDSMMVFHRGMEISDGVLKFIEDHPGCNLRLPYGQNSLTEFRMRLLDVDFDTHISLLWDHEKEHSLDFHFEPHGEVHLKMQAFGELLEGRSAGVALIPDTWHQLRIELIDDQTTLFIDGTEVISAPIHESMPDSGFFFPIAHESQMEIDDLRIINLGQQGAKALELPPIEGEIIYRTGFDEEEGRFEYHRGTRIHNGILDFFEDSPGCNFSELYGQDSVTQFRLLLPGPGDSAHISLLWAPADGMRVLYIIEPGYIGLEIEADGDHVHHDETQAPVLPGEWYTVRIELRQEVSRLWLNGRQYIEASLDPRLPQKGWFFPLAHESQMQMDDLVIAELPRHEAVAADEIQVSHRTKTTQATGI